MTDLIAEGYVSSDFEKIDVAYNTIQTSGHSEEPDNYWSNAQYRITHLPAQSQAETLSKREGKKQNQTYKRVKLTYGGRKMKKRGRHRANEFKALVMCKLCGRNLPNVPDCTLTKDIVQQFLKDYAGICPCKPPHCDVCTCGQCFKDIQLHTGKIEPEKSNYRETPNKLPWVSASLRDLKGAFSPFST